MNVSKIDMAFDAWFARNYDKLKQKCVPYTLFGELYNVNTEDVFHDAYLIARNAVLSSDETEYETIFVAAYKRQSKMYYKANDQEIRPSDLFWSLLKSEEESESKQTEQKKQRFEDLANKIKRFAFVTFSADEYNVFCLYFKNGLSMDNVGAVLGVNRSAICKRLFGMRHLLCAKFETEFINL